MGAPQGSDEWLRERSGHVTASRLSDVLAKGKTGEAAGRRNYRMQLVTERLVCGPVDQYKNAAMQWGNDHEEEARATVEQELGITIITTGFVKHPKHEWLGCSPDGLIDHDGLVQIKCPYVSTNHVETIFTGVVPPQYISQIQGEMWVTGRLYSIYASYDPRMPQNLRLFTKRVERDDKFIRAMELEVLTFLAETEAMHKRLANRK